MGFKMNHQERSTLYILPVLRYVLSMLKNISDIKKQ